MDGPKARLKLEKKKRQVNKWRGWMASTLGVGEAEVLMPSWAQLPACSHRSTGCTRGLVKCKVRLLTRSEGRVWGGGQASMSRNDQQTQCHMMRKERRWLR